MPLSLTSLSLALRRAGGGDATVHGLRSTFRDWTRLQGEDRELAELPLAHAVGDMTERAYARDDLLDRRGLLRRWAAYATSALQGCSRTPPVPAARRIRAVVATAVVREALRPRAIDTGGGFDLVLAIFELGRSDGPRAMAKKGGNARRRPNLISKMNRWMVYEGVMQGNPQVWRHPHALQHLRMLQQGLAAKGSRRPALPPSARTLRR